MQALRPGYARVLGWLVPAILLALAMVPGAVGARIDGDVYQEHQQDLSLAILRGVLGS